MMKNFYHVTLLCLTLFLPSFVIAQGCSDAGFCTIGNLRQSTESSDNGRHRLDLIIAMGSGDEGVFVLTPALQYEFLINKQWNVQAKLTTNFASGNLGSTGDLGDFYLSGTYGINPEQKWKWSITAGVKVPFNQADLEENGNPLPMQYQSSLGTFDAIAGVSVKSEKWQFSAGLQLPVSGSNNNGFLPSLWPGNNDAAKYPATSSFNRKPDVLLRGAYQFVTNKKIQLNAGLLGIYHVSPDTYKDSSQSDMPITIKGSDGLTLNLTASAKWSVSRKLQIGIVAGTPVIVREVRPDGLTRSFVLAPEVRWNF